MTRGRSDGSQKKRLIATICVVAIFLGFLYAYYGSIFGNQDSALQHGSKSLSHYLMRNEDSEESSTTTEQEDADDDVIPKSYPVSYCLYLNGVLIKTLLSFSIEREQIIHWSSLLYIFNLFL